MSNVFTAVFVRLRNTYVQSGLSIKLMKHLDFDASFDLLVSTYLLSVLTSDLQDIDTIWHHKGY